MPENQNKSGQAGSQSSSAPAPAASSSELLLAQALAKITELMERQTDQAEFAQKNAPRRKKTMAEYLDEKPRKRLKHEAYQNGRLVNAAGLSQETINKLDTLATGKYAEGLVDVVRISDGIGGLHSRIHIVYNNRSTEQRMQFYMKFPTFTQLVNTIIGEMAARKIAQVNEPCADPIEPEINIGG